MQPTSIVDLIVILLERPSTSRITDIVGELLAEESCVILRASPRMYGAMAMNWLLQSCFAGNWKVRVKQDLEVKELESFVVPL